MNERTEPRQHMRLTKLSLSIKKSGSLIARCCRTSTRFAIPSFRLYNHLTKLNERERTLFEIDAILI